MEITGKEIKKAIENYLNRDIELKEVYLNGDREKIKSLNELNLKVKIK